MTKNKKIIALIKVEAGFGDISWGFRLFEEIVPFHDIKVVFYNCMEKQINFLKKNHVFKNCDNLESLHCNFNVYNSSQINLEYLVNFYDYIINFHFLMYDQFHHKKVINIDEYGKSTDNIKFLLKDFTNIYKHITNWENLPRKLKYLNINQTYNVTLIKDMIKSPYYFTYYAKLDIVKDVFSLFYFINLILDYTKLTNIRILTNYSFEIHNENFETVFNLLEEEKKTKGFTSKYTILYYINRMGNFMIRRTKKYQLELMVNDKFIQIDSYDVLSKVEYDCLLLNSEKIVGCTGDMSISECISTDRIFVYQTLNHKLNFRYILNNMFNKYSSQKDALMNFMFDPCMIEKKSNLNFAQFCKEWRFFYENVIQKENFTDWILSLIK